MPKVSPKDITVCLKRIIFAPKIRLAMADYSVKQIQERILSIMLVIDKVCREHNITYYLSDGTMLGAVRHGGGARRGTQGTGLRPSAVLCLVL